VYEIICPHCGEAIELDEAGYAELVEQAQNHQTEQELLATVEIGEQEKLNAIDPVESSVSHPHAQNQTWPLFEYPPHAQDGSLLPKYRIYERTFVDTFTKALFVRQVAQILVRYWLTPKTVNLPAGNGVDEIRIYRI
jgi:hypothetical protein